MWITFSGILDVLAQCKCVNSLRSLPQSDKKPQAKTSLHVCMSWFGCAKEIKRYICSVEAVHKDTRLQEFLESDIPDHQFTSVAD